MNIFNKNKIYTCSKYNYSGINSLCPDCNIENINLHEALMAAVKVIAYSQCLPAWPKEYKDACNTFFAIMKKVEGK
jgi:ABC-type Fe3+-citrate transport system substrate-binding protein